MALALSLSLDLFLMKGNLFIAVRAQPEDRQTDRQGGRQTGRESDRTSPKGGVEEKKTKEKKRRAEQRDVVNVFHKESQGRESAEPLDTRLDSRQQCNRQNHYNIITKPTFV